MAFDAERLRRTLPPASPPMLEIDPDHLISTACIDSIKLAAPDRQSGSHPSRTAPSIGKEPLRSRPRARNNPCRTWSGRK